MSAAVVGPSRPRVIGRTAELAALEAFVADPAEHPRGLVLAGEPGVGKSTLWEAGRAAAAGAGVPVLATSCAEAESAMSYVTLDDLVGDLLDAGDADLPEPQRAAVETALLRRSTTTTADPRTVAVGVLSLLRSRLEGGPLVVAVDDEQWLDPETRRCLAFVARRLADRPLRVLLATRTASPWWTPAPDRPEPEALVGPGAEVTTFELDGLTAPCVELLLADRVAPVSRARAREIAAETGGNPFWAMERGRGGATGERLGALVAERLEAAGPVVAEVAALVAALGRVRPAALLAATRGGEELLDAAVTVGLVLARDGSLVPSHPLVGAAMLEALPPFRRRALHRRAAALAGSVEERAEQLLRAADLADDPEDTADLIETLDAAAVAAQRRGAAIGAVRFADEAVRRDGGDADAAPARRIRAAELHFRDGGFARCQDLLGTLDLATLDADTFDVVVPLLADATYRARGESAARELVAGLADLPGADDDRLARRRVAVTTTLRSEPVYGNADRATTAAAAVDAVSESLPAVVRRALGYLAFARLDAGEPIDDELWARHAALAAAEGADGDVDGIQLVRGRALEVDDRLDEARAHLAARAGLARDAGDDIGVLRAGLSLAYGHYIAGRPDLAASEIEALPDAGAVEPPELMGVRGMLRLAAADHTGVAAVIEEGEAARPVLPRRRLLVEYLAGLLAWQDGDPADAAAKLWHVLSTAVGRGLREPGRRLLVDADLGDALLAVGECARVGQLVDHLDGIARGRPTPTGLAERLRAGLATARDDPDAAVVHARAAVHHHRRGPRPPELGRSLLVLGRVELARGAEGADEHLREARSVFDSSGFVWWCRRADEALAEATPRDPLSVAERAVADLVASGASNREASVALHLSIRTVEYHLRSVYRKLGVRSRTELAALPHDRPVPH
ncbi:helix-turn-helix transcriptional regulator [Actinomycetospora termitidis]|uniref:LuxR family transcriptional regulator n=1 Tax=Actinomycetospora termitidis TaxID=3053470 RepID=A0ABT7MGZ3_9PSEU|nr:LuxR family transcriptional regulator [Actinomycetospora sp. Odt1-22]MDL5158608.1 LuxR family transcriptional regulator [Actinomycetospora sp. Odt1-22]